MNEKLEFEGLNKNSLRIRGFLGWLYKKARIVGFVQSEKKNKERLKLDGNKTKDTNIPSH